MNTTDPIDSTYYDPNDQWVAAYLRGYLEADLVAIGHRALTYRASPHGPLTFAQTIAYALAAAIR